MGLDDDGDPVCAFCLYPAMRAWGSTLVGLRFGRIVAVEERGLDARRVVRWQCRCDCGRVLVAPRDHLVRGAVLSCGCWKRSTLQRRAERHEWRGELLSILDLAILAGIAPSTLLWRLDAGWTLERAMTGVQCTHYATGGP